VTLAELDAHAKRTAAELALCIKGIETEIAADQGQAAMLNNALTRLMECSLWLAQAVKSASEPAANEPRIIS